MVQTGLSYDDVLIIPQYSNIKSRKEVDLTSNLDNLRSLSLPVIAAPMDTVCEEQMAVHMYSLGGLGVIHRYNTIEQQTSMFATVKSLKSDAIVAIPATGDYMERALSLHEAGCSMFCIDVAHGHTEYVKRAIKNMRSKFSSNIHIMAGNIATAEAVVDLTEWGADSVRVGIGGGSACTTRIVTGHGVPNFSAISACASADTGISLIADGGIRNSGDAVKAIAAGADLVMLGSVLAGTDSSPGEPFRDKKTGKMYKKFRGMASTAAQEDWRGRTSVEEGVSHVVPYKGNLFDDVVRGFKEGMQSGLSYSGCRGIQEFQHKCSFIIQTSAGATESSPHVVTRGVHV